MNEEKKQEVLDVLCKALQLTREGAAIDHIEYSYDRGVAEWATVYYTDGRARNHINITDIREGISARIIREIAQGVMYG